MSCDGDVSMGLYSAKRGRFWVVLGLKGRKNMLFLETHTAINLCSRAERWGTLDQEAWYSGMLDKENV